MFEAPRLYEIRTIKAGLAVNSRLLKMAWGLAGTILLAIALLVAYLWADNGLTSALSNQSAAVAWPTYAFLALAAAMSAIVVTVFTRGKLDLETQLALLQRKPHDS